MQERIEENIFFWIAAIVLVLFMWLPFGFQLGGLIEEWGVLGLFTEHGSFLFAGPDSPLAAHRLRPFTVLPHALGFMFNPDSFMGWHIILMLTLVLKSVCGSFLFWWITRIRWMAVFLGMLLVVYPADTMQLAFRSLHIDLSLSLILVAAVLQIVAFEIKNIFLKILSIALVCGAALTAVWSYEAALLLMPVPFLIIYVREGWLGLYTKMRTHPWVVLPWLLTGVFCVAYILYVLTHGNSVYQSDVVGPIGALAAKVNLKAVILGFFRDWFGGWLDAVRIVGSEFQNYTYLITASAACIGVALWPRRSKGAATTVSEPKVPHTQIVRMALVAVVLSFLGYAPYLTSGSHLQISQRTFLFASLGAVLLWGTLGLVLSRFYRLSAKILFSALMLVGLGMQLFQFQHYIQISNTQKKILRQIVENVPDIPKDKSFVIFDASQRLNHTWMLRDNLTSALMYIYGKKIKPVMICLEPNRVWQKNDTLARPGLCVETPTKWVFKAAPSVAGPGVSTIIPAGDIVLDKSDVITLAIGQDGAVLPTEAVVRRRIHLRDSQDLISRRYRGVLVSNSYLDFHLFKEQALSPEYRWDFGRWWSMEVPPQGQGWREADWYVGFMHHISTAWKNLPEASLLFELAPEEKPYVLRGRFTTFAPGIKKTDFQFKINGHTLKYQWDDEYEFSAEMNPQILKRGLNVLEISSPTNSDYFGLSASMDWVKVKPEIKQKM